MKLTIIGASGHGKIIADIARLRGYREMEFLDDAPSLTSCYDIPVTEKAPMKYGSSGRRTLRARHWRWSS